MTKCSLTEIYYCMLSVLWQKTLFLRKTLLKNVWIINMFIDKEKLKDSLVSIHKTLRKSKRSKSCAIRKRIDRKRIYIFFWKRNKWGAIFAKIIKKEEDYGKIILLFLLLHHHFQNLILLLALLVPFVGLHNFSQEYMDKRKYCRTMSHYFLHE